MAVSGLKATLQSHLWCWVYLPNTLGYFFIPKSLAELEFCGIIKSKKLEIKKLGIGDMTLSIEAIKTILDIQDGLKLTEVKMAKDLSVTFFPYVGRNASYRAKDFAQNLKKTFVSLGVEVIPYEKTLVVIPWPRKVKMAFRLILLNFKNLFKGQFKFVKFNLGKKIKKGIAVIAVGEGETGNLPIDHVMSLRKNPIVTIIDKPNNIAKNSSFQQHTETALKIFAWNITNLIISVDEKNWTLYSFNMSYPIYQLDQDFQENILHALIPKIYAPVTPPRISEFVIHKGAFVPDDGKNQAYVDDLVKSGPLFQETRLYPSQKKVQDLPFRNSFYRWLGSLLLDKRTGMSYGFLARQLPVKSSPLIGHKEIQNELNFSKDNDHFFYNNNLYIILDLENEKYALQVPEVWVLTSRSGSEKTNLNPQKDIIKMGLINGKMIMETPSGLKLSSDYKPSFDTKVIFSHAVANAIFASVLKHFNPKSEFVKKIETNGLALAHWHGYFKPDLIPSSWVSYGHKNPPVSCSSPQSAIFAFQGKEKVMIETIKSQKDFSVDVHIEPQHGINITYSSLQALSQYLIKNPKTTRLGNAYFRS